MYNLFLCEGVDEISSVDSLQFDIGTIKVATDNFSAANELGKGGFGIVYKVMRPNRAIIYVILLVIIS